MKNISKLVVTLLSSAMVCSIVGCGSSVQSNSASVPTESVTVSSSSVTEVDSQEVRDQLDKINEQNNYIGSFVGLVWYTAGPDNVAYMLDFYKSVNTIDDLQTKVDTYDDITTKCAEYLGIDMDLTFFGKEEEEQEGKFLDACTTYQDDLDSNEEEIRKVKGELRQLKKVDSDSFDLLKNYYDETVSYYELVSDPSGSYESFSTEFNDYKDEIEKIQDDLDIELF